MADDEPPSNEHYSSWLWTGIVAFGWPPLLATAYSLACIFGDWTVLNYGMPAFLLMFVNFPFLCGTMHRQLRPDAHSAERLTHAFDLVLFVLMVLFVETVIIVPCTMIMVFFSHGHAG